jgi:hypothetical protein
VFDQILFFRTIANLAFKNINGEVFKKLTFSILKVWHKLVRPRKLKLRNKWVTM